MREVFFDSNIEQSYCVSHCKGTKKLPFSLTLSRVFRMRLNNMITVSETAKAKLAALMSEEGKSLESTYISVGVESGGCSGLSYTMNFVAEMPENSELYEDNGVKVVVEKKALLYLIGTTLEYSGGLNGKGFNFNNPNATRTCGCGESFAV